MTIYLIKSLFSLAFFYVGYLIIAKEKRFELARFYLLGTVLISLVAPIFPITINYSFQTFDQTQEVFQSISNKISNSSIPTNHSEGSNTTTETSQTLVLIIGLYLLGCVVMLHRYVRNLLSILSLFRKSEKRKEKEFRLALVKEDIVPFSFGSYVFMNQSDSLDTELNQHILIHEQAHTKNLHTLDNILIETLLIFYWFNPMLWIYRRAIKENHEFIADQSVLKTKDIALYADFILSAAQRNTTTIFRSNFNYFLTKKRLLMMNRTKTSKLNFGYKLAGTLLVVLVSSLIFAFKPAKNESSKDGNFVVVIDASHGGKDDGAINAKLNLKEKDITLAISKEISSVSNNNRITYVFTRKNDETVGLNERVDFINKTKPNLVISLHSNQSTDVNLQGLEVYYSEENTDAKKSKSYAEMFKNNVRIGKSASQVKSARFKLIKNVNCPSVLLEMGYISNNEDLKFIKSPKNQRYIATRIAEVVNTISDI